MIGMSSGVSMHVYFAVMDNVAVLVCTCIEIQVTVLLTQYETVFVTKITKITIR